MAHSYRPWSFGQVSLLPINPADWLAADHLAIVLPDVLEQIDLSSFLVNGTETRGAAGFHPKMMLYIIVYCLLRRQVSARSMERFIHDDIGCRYLTGGAGIPAWRCIAAFRKEYRSRLAGLLPKTVQLCVAAGLVDMSVVFADGSKFESRSGARRNIRYERCDKDAARLQQIAMQLLAEADELDEKETRAEEAAPKRVIAATVQERVRRIAEAKERIERECAERKQKWDDAPSQERQHRSPPTGTPAGKERSNTVEPDSRVMKFGDQTFRQGYNVQIAAEGSHQIIVGASLSNDPTDVQQLPATLQSVIETTGTVPGTWVADGGYLSQANLKCLDAHEVEPIISPSRSAASRPSPDAVDPQDESPQSAPNQKPSAAKARMLAKFEEDDTRAIYDKRKQICEPIFGQLKGCPGRPGMRRFSVRGQEACRLETMIMCAVHNLGKCITSRIRKGENERATNQDQAKLRLTSAQNLQISINWA